MIFCQRNGHVIRQLPALLVDFPSAKRYMPVGKNLSVEFEVTGHFYTSEGYKLRRYLDIKRVSAAPNKPDLMVVMMNPGSSFPLDGIDNNSEPSKAYPDTTQYQIMKVMDVA